MSLVMQVRPQTVTFPKVPSSWRITRLPHGLLFRPSQRKTKNLPRLCSCLWLNAWWRKWWRKRRSKQKPRSVVCLHDAQHCLHLSWKDLNTDLNWMMGFIRKIHLCKFPLCGFFFVVAGFYSSPQHKVPQLPFTFVCDRRCSCTSWSWSVWESVSRLSTWSGAHLVVCMSAAVLLARKRTSDCVWMPEYMNTRWDVSQM